MKAFLNVPLPARPEPDEGARLIRALLRIPSADARKALIAHAEELASREGAANQNRVLTEDQAL